MNRTLTSCDFFSKDGTRYQATATYLYDYTPSTYDHPFDLTEKWEDLEVFKVDEDGNLIPVKDYSVWLETEILQQLSYDRDRRI